MQLLENGARELGITLDTEQLERFETYYRELVEWNRKMNLTRIIGYEEVQMKHFLDSLTVTAAMKQTEDALRVIDVGTGAGLPGLPLKIALTGLHLTLLESTAKKTRFLNHLVEKLGLTDVEIVTGRAEDIARDDEYREKFDVVLSRAVASLPSLVELTMPFCAVGGRFIAQKKGAMDEELCISMKAIDVMGGRLDGTKQVSLPAAGDDRVLIVIDKVRLTPPEYPRRAGVPARKPILD